MHPWSPLDDRQLALLTHIQDGTDPVTSDSPELALTARALKERRLITMRKQSGKWQAEITDAGRFYLQHGHHPDRPEPAQRKQRSAGSDQRTRPALPPQKQATAPSTTKPAPQRDAKYKADSVRGFPNTDLYQMASYCLGLGLDRGHLIYAAGERPALRHTVRHSGIELIQHTVPLAAEPPAVLTAMSRIAAALANES